MKANFEPETPAEVEAFFKAHAVVVRPWDGSVFERSKASVPPSKPVTETSKATKDIASVFADGFHECRAMVQPESSEPNVSGIHADIADYFRRLDDEG